MTDERFPNWDIDVEEGKIYSLRLSRYIGAINEKGYVHVSKQKGYKHCKLHQYIWMTANGCEIPSGYDVHHIDGNKSNNSIYNLELVEHKKHMNEHNKEKKKKVAQFTLDGELVNLWDSTNECGRNGFNQAHVADCCRGERKTHKGFIWRYYNEEKEVA